MNIEQLQNQVGTNLRLRPLPVRIGPDGNVLPASDDQWHLEEILNGPTRLRLINVATHHVLELQPDNVQEYRSQDFLMLRCQVYMVARRVWFEPLQKGTSPSEASTITARVVKAVRSQRAAEIRDERKKMAQELRPKPAPPDKGADVHYRLGQKALGARPSEAPRKRGG